MGKLIYLITTTLDGYAADKKGNFNWAVPSEESHAFVNDQLRNVGTILMGHRLYDVMKVWEGAPTEGIGGIIDDVSPAMNDYAKIWKGANKIVYSTSLSELEIENATIERSFDPEVIKKKVAESDKDFDIGGPTLAAQAIRANIIDEYHQIVAPLMIGGGLHWLPEGANLKLKLVDVHKFDNGLVHLQYGVK